MTPERGQMCVVFSQNLSEKGGWKCEEQVEGRGSSWCPNKHRNQNPAVPKPLLSGSGDGKDAPRPVPDAAGSYVTPKGAQEEAGDRICRADRC